ncbi:acyl-CoA dehydrogenase family protein [Bradyrhizobium sp. U87765 SZCCT0131]|uniref:acyl-CoA dehydrogenase family protein n=1 Tax=unclassified Bradyrhizobium TaxID=2631580 RepID=UPI001BAAEAE6|nr:MULTISPECIES: acyl-CoA dehydrogenase family protein [unclassified Bradyrhizobium]MBR1221964.1 acyl-CoA dehydrogenase family protein [Bradyrhizobium sp. U87765 SZCCT0131]MBR1263838.1 acyl-CoA dehydrogenase family protein [Bradyrhizobium sp. U87765 SZCCT0134]MBR1302592.1 acyl-CoA dehydrogenase family protein [Bradyrhizobium sp. U87765 SZCCT0110]MBR1320088.1 acyl-CoA dehydrogenase family protein [Bradyrhizobium sp. U87765 SZCCT0109]MBR1348799.1 acyl-CoA dehydrogenase family protein [Bradyrhizo
MKADLDLAGPIPDSRGLNLYRADRDSAALFGHYLPDALFRHLAPTFDRLGGLAGGRLDELAAIADHNPPTLSVRRRTGEDCNVVEKHPAYVEMEKLAFAELGLAAVSHRGALGWAEPMPPAAKYALTYLFVQAEFGLMCPVSMTDSLTRTLKRYGDPNLVGRFIERLTTLDFDELTQGAMFMTEQGAGSDVAATATRATLQADGTWQLTGDKWFCSNADADLAMVLARSEDAPGLKGVSLFLLPRIRGDGTPNAYRILRLKDKLGTRSMASGEIRLEGAEAYLVGERGRGFHQMADMVNNSRLSNGVRAAGLMRRATSEALFIARRRQAFGKRLIELPLMRRQLAKMLVWTEQARSMMFLTADALDRANRGEAEGARLARIMTPLIKFRACRDARKVTGDAMEVRGGCGYIEEWPDARLLRDAHLGSIWEGTSNIVALDVSRAIARDDALPALKAHNAALLKAAALDAPTQALFAGQLERACAFAADVAARKAEPQARQAASALYHITSAIGLAHEAAAIAAPHRLALARLVLTHRLLPRDPLVVDDAEAADIDSVLAG